MELDGRRYPAIGHDLNSGKQKYNFKGKPANDLIIPNEYTFDLIPLPLFYVDILDSQISAHIFYVGQHWHEKYHIIQIIYLDNSIWQGKVWSKISFKINFYKNFLHSSRKGVLFTLHPEI